MLAVIGIAAVKVTTPSCDPYGTYLRTEGCNDIYADGSCGTYSQDNGSCPAYGTYLRTEGCDDIYADGSGGEYSEDNGSCDSCEGCDTAGTLQSTGTGTPWAGTVDAEGTDWQINYYDYQYSDGCCGTYSERHWFIDVSPPVELSSPDGGVSPNPPAGYVLTASAVYPLEPDGNTYATYSEDPMWLTPMFTNEEHDQPWSSYKILADGSGGSYNNQTVQPADTVMSNPFIWMFNGKYVKYYSTGTTYDGGYGINPYFEIRSCPAYGTYIETVETGVDWTIEITLESLGTPYALRVGTKDQDQIDNGECGRIVIDTNQTPEPADTLLYDEPISSYYYYSDGAGGYYATFYG